MAINVKLRVCTWNVGNAAPPHDLKAWLGTQTDEFDIIAIGAQETAYGAQKSTNSLALSSPKVSKELRLRMNTDDQAENAISQHGHNFRPLRKLSKAFRGAKDSVKDNSMRKAKSKINMQPEFQSTRDLEENQRTENRCDEKTDVRCKQTSSKELELTIISRRRSRFHRLEVKPVLHLSPRSKKVKTFNSNEVNKETVIKNCSDDFGEVRSHTMPVSNTICSNIAHEDPSDPDLYRRHTADARFHQRLNDKDRQIINSPSLLPSEDNNLKSTDKNTRNLNNDASAKKNAPLPNETCDDKEKNNNNVDSNSNKETNANVEIIREENPDSEIKEKENVESWVLYSPKLVRSQARISFQANTSENSQNADIDEKELGKVSLEPPAFRKFSRIVADNMPGEYHLVAKHNLMEIRLIIYVHERVRRYVKKIDCVSEATGIGNVVGNKGGVAVKLLLNDTSICFVCCHLAAHEGTKYLQQRNEDIAEIMRNIERHRTLGLPVIHQFDHIFWLGDLNYRLDLKQVLPGATRWSHGDRFKYVTHLIGQGRYEDVYRLDELHAEMQRGSVLSGFEEGTVKFAPTFKCGRGAGALRYQDGRVPSYCDRILWHSLGFHREHVQILNYSSVPLVDTSDHKPVYASFKMMIPTAAAFIPLGMRKCGICVTVDFLSLRVDGLYEKDSSRDGDDNDNLEYAILEDGALEASPKLGTVTKPTRTIAPMIGHTRRIVTALFFGGGMLVCERGHRTEVPIRGGKRLCLQHELPSLAIRTVRSLNDLKYKYIRIVFGRLGSRQGSSCIVPLGRLLEQKGKSVDKMQLDVTKYGRKVAQVEIEAQLVIGTDTWIDADNCVMRVKGR